MVFIDYFTLPKYKFYYPFYYSTKSPVFRDCLASAGEITLVKNWQVMVYKGRK